MKSLLAFFVCILLTTGLTAQEKFTVPQLTSDQKTEVLFNHVMAYSVTGISFAKAQGVSAEDYGRFIGKKFTAFWNPDDGFPMLANRMMFILAGMYPDNQMEIVEQDENSIKFKLKNVDLAFRQGPMFDVKYQDFLNCSYGIISELADFMGCEFSHKMTDDVWYVVYVSQMN